MNEQSLFQDRVRERDLDNFLIEELYASTQFREWLLSRLAHVFDAPESYDIRLQKSPPRLLDNRQTDVRIGWFSPDGTLRACVLIESKVTADFQTGQAESYAIELSEHRAHLGKRAACSVLVAPQSKLAALNHDGAFDIDVTIEEIIDTLIDRRTEEGLAPELSARLSARIDLLEALCGKRSATQWTPITIEEKRNFAHAYAAMAVEILPTLRVRPSSDGPQAITRIFEGITLSHDLPALTLRHEFGFGVPWKYANIQFAGVVGRLPELVSSKILEGTPYNWAAAGKSLALRVETPGVDPTKPFAEEREKVRTGLNAIRDLLEWLGTNASALEILLKATNGTGNGAQPKSGPRSVDKSALFT